MPNANNKCTDQPAHPHCLISTLVVRRLDSIIPLVSSLYLDSVAAQAGLSLTWSEIPETGFLRTWPKLNAYTVRTEEMEKYCL